MEWRRRRACEWLRDGRLAIRDVALATFIQSGLTKRREAVR